METNRKNQWTWRLHVWNQWGFRQTGNIHWSRGSGTECKSLLFYIRALNRCLENTVTFPHTNTLPSLFSVSVQAVVGEGVFWGGGGGGVTKTVGLMSLFSIYFVFSYVSQPVLLCRYWWHVVVVVNCVWWWRLFKAFVLLLKQFHQVISFRRFRMQSAQTNQKSVYVLLWPHTVLSTSADGTVLVLWSTYTHTVLLQYCTELYFSVFDIVKLGLK